MVRTEKEIQKAIEDLKIMRKNMPHYSMFGDNNWASLDAQIAILEGNKHYSDYEDYEPNVNSAAYDAENWLNDKNADPLYDADETWLNDKS